MYKLIFYWYFSNNNLYIPMNTPLNSCQRFWCKYCVLFLVVWTQISWITCTQECHNSNFSSNMFKKLSPPSFPLQINWNTLDFFNEDEHICTVYRMLSKSPSQDKRVDESVIKLDKTLFKSRNTKCKINLSIFDEYVSFILQLMTNLRIQSYKRRCNIGILTSYWKWFFFKL